MKRRRFPLALAFLLPTLLLLAAIEGGIYLGGYFVLRDTATDTAVKNDANDLLDMRALLADDDTTTGTMTVLSYALPPVVRAYESHKPAVLPAPGSPQEVAYYKAILQEANPGQLYIAARNTITRFVTDMIAIFYEDVAAQRMVTVLTADSDFGNPDVGPSGISSLYLGSFIPRTSIFNGTEFYGERWNDRKLGEVFVSGRLLGEIDPIRPQPGDVPFRVWLVRETKMEDVYAVTPRFNRLFAIIAGSSLALLSLLIFFWTRFIFIRPLRKLSKQGNAYVQALKEGHAEGPFLLSNSRYLNESTDLNDALFYTQEAIVDYAKQVHEAAAYEERIQAELALAEKLQASMVPSAPLSGDNFLFRGQMTPAKEVGGDLYNYFFLDDTHVGFFIGDVSGKGVPAALFMAKANAMLRLIVKDFAIEQANAILCEDNVENFFLTAFIATLDLTTGELTYVNCGHEPVFIYHDGVYSALPEEANFMLGCLPDFPFKVQKAKLAPGDRLFLYTDGLSEAMNLQGDLFGKKRILDCLNANAGKNSEGIFDAMHEDIRAFVSGAEQSDDACMVALDFGKQASLAFPCSLEGLAEVSPFADEFLEGKSMKDIAQIQVVLDEICTNIVSYSEGKEATLLLEDLGDKIRITLTDDGKPFDPLGEIPKKEDPEAPGGHGIHLAKEMTDKMEYKRVNDRNILTLEKATSE